MERGELSCLWRSLSRRLWRDLAIILRRADGRDRRDRRDRIGVGGHGHRHRALNIGEEQPSIGGEDSTHP
jgi:hypothetical protein